LAHRRSRDAGRDRPWCRKGVWLFCCLLGPSTGGGKNCFLRTSTVMSCEQVHAEASVCRAWTRRCATPVSAPYMTSDKPFYVTGDPWGCGSSQALQPAPARTDPTAWRGSAPQRRLEARAAGDRRTGRAPRGRCQRGYLTPRPWGGPGGERERPVRRCTTSWAPFL